MSYKDPIFNEPAFESGGGLGPTSRSGVYAVCVMETDWTRIGDKIRRNPNKVVYIGSAKNIAKRVNGTNHIFRRVHNLTKNYLVYVMDMPCDDYREKERLMIRKYKPRFNKQHAR